MQSACREHVSILPRCSLPWAGCRLLYWRLPSASSQSPRDALPLPGCCLDGAALAAVNLQLISIFTLLYLERCGILDESWAGERLFFTFTAPQCRKLLKTGDSWIARDGNRRELPAGFQVASHGWLPRWKTGAVVALAALLAPRGACVAPAAGGTARATARSSQRDIYLCPGGRRPGGKKHERWDENQPGEKGPWAKSAAAANVINGRPGGGAGATLSKHGRGRWMLSQKQCCKPTQNAPDTGKEKYYSPVLKIKSLIRYPENGAGSALLLLLGHPRCHPALGTGTRTLRWVWQCRCPGNEGMLLRAQGGTRRVKAEQDARSLLDPPSAETELQLGLAEVTISCKLPGSPLSHRSAYTPLVNKTPFFDITHVLILFPCRRAQAAAVREEADLPSQAGCRDCECPPGF